MSDPLGRTLPGQVMIIALALLLSGCQTRPMLTDRPLQLKAPQADPFTAARDVLTGHGFTVEQVDRRAGVIYAKPLLSRQWFEFWRTDVSSASDTVHAGLQTVRRVVTVMLHQESDTLQIDCEVLIEQLAAARPEKVKRIRSRDIFGSNPRQAPTLALQHTNTNPPDWIPLGRDRVLEEKILLKVAQLAL